MKTEIKPATLAEKILVMKKLENIFARVKKTAINEIQLYYFASTWKGEFYYPKPDSTLYGEVRVGVLFTEITYDSLETDEDRQEMREAAALELLDLIPGSFLTRATYGSVFLGVVIDGVTVSIDIGKAFCQKVEVGTRTVQKPAPDAPMVDVEEPIYEYRCTDDILGAMPQAESAS